MNVPQHIAIILDGNGRWAKAKGMPRNYGHVQGSKNVEKICEAAYKMGVKYLTVYAFSTENWSRPKSEVEASKNNDGLNFQIAINYGSRDEMIRAMRKMTKDCANGRFAPEEITEELFEGYLDTHGIPDPDLLIRTSGELRLSNYLLWQLAYTEFYFTDVPWPDFSKEELEKAIEQYNSRDRRYGGIKEDEENV